MCRYYESLATYSKSDAEVLKPLTSALESTPVARLTYSWVEDWVEVMKRDLKPSTLKKRVGLLARVVDWAMRRNLISLTNNPVRLLPKGYATKGVDRSSLWDGERTRRLEAGEEEAIRKVLKGEEEPLLFDLALETGMRLSEMTTLTLEQIDLQRRTIFLDKTKNGSKTAGSSVEHSSPVAGKISGLAPVGLPQSVFVGSFVCERRPQSPLPSFRIALCQGRLPGPSFS